MGKIERKVDKLLIAKGDRIKFNQTKRLKIPATVVSVLMVVSIVAIAGIMAYYFRATTTINTEELFTFDDQPSQMYLIDRTINNAVGGNIYTFSHYLNASQYIQTSVNLTFTWSGNDSADGITPELLYSGSPIDYLVIEPDTDYIITERYTLDPMITEEQYVCMLTTTATL